MLCGAFDGPALVRATRTFDAYEPHGRSFQYALGVDVAQKFLDRFERWGIEVDSFFDAITLGRISEQEFEAEAARRSADGTLDGIVEWARSLLNDPACLDGTHRVWGTNLMFTGHAGEA